MRYPVSVRPSRPGASPLGSFAAIAAVALAAGVLGFVLIMASEKGAKWLVMVALGYLAISAGLLFNDKRLFGVWLLAGCVPIGFQYNLWSHGSRFSFIDHFGGALPEPVINLVDLPIALLILMWIVDLRLGVKALPRWTGTDTLLMCLLGVSTFSLYITDEYALFAFEMLRYLKYLCLFWILRTYLDQPKYFWGILGINIWLLSLQGIVSLMQYFFFFQFPIPVGGVVGTDVEMIDNEIVQRVTGILGHSNTFAAYLTVMCSVCLIVLFSRVKNLYKLAVLPFLLGGLVSLVLTFSRNGWLVFALDCLFIGIWSLRTKRLHFGYVTGLVCLAVFLVGSLAASGVLDTMLSRVFREKANTLESRWDLALVAWEMISDHPVAGIGLNSFEESMIHYDPNHITHIIRQPVHNGFLLVAAETGLPAMALLIAALWAFLRTSWRVLRRDGELHFAVGMTGIVTFAGLGVANLFDVSLRKESICGVIVLVAAMVMSLRRMDESAVPAGQAVPTDGAADRPPASWGSHAPL